MIISLQAEECFKECISLNQKHIYGYEIFYFFM